MFLNNMRSLQLPLSLILLLILFSFGLFGFGEARHTTTHLPMGEASFQEGRILIPMDDSQSNHLKAYGLVFNQLENGQPAQWLLNYRGGSFLTIYREETVREARLKNIRLELLSEPEAAQLLQQVEQPGQNTASIRLEKSPAIAVYTPPHSLPWDDAVTLALDYAEVPYDRIYDREVLGGALEQYDWLHLHHEDFTGQYGKFWAVYRNMPWYIADVERMESLAQELGFDKVSDLKLAVALKIRDYVGNGGFLFAMCSGTNTLDIALAAEKIDIVPEPFDYDPADPEASGRLDYTKSLVFENFSVVTDPWVYRHDDIDIEVQLDRIAESLDYFTLFEFSARWDPVPAMLTQNHVSSIKGFYGQTTAFRKEKIKSHVVILGETPGRGQVKYLHGNYGAGTFTFYGGHDPEDYTHRVNDPPTDLSLFPNSPGYRLILNNILFPAAQEQELKTALPVPAGRKMPAT